MTDTKQAINNAEKELAKSSQTGMFSLSTVAINRINEKRKRRGLGELKPRENSVWKQFV